MGRKKITNYTVHDRADIQARIEHTLSILECETAKRSLNTVIKKAENEGLPYLDFLDLVFDQEMNDREDKRILRWQNKARFPWIKALDEYDFSYPEKIEKDKVLTLAQCQWIDGGGNVIFFGPSGVGKTHLSIALGLEAIKRGYETRFMVMEYLTENITTALNKDKNREGGENRKKLLNMLMNYKLLILDDMAYSHISEDVANFLFMLICRRYDLNKSTIFTSNEGVDKWEKYFAGDKVRAMAALDRIMEDCVAISIHGQSFRMGGIKK